MQFLSISSNWCTVTIIWGLFDWKTHVNPRWSTLWIDAGHGSHGGKFQGFPGVVGFWVRKKGMNNAIQGQEARIQWKSKALCVCVCFFCFCGDIFLKHVLKIIVCFFQKGLGYSTSIVCWCWNLNIQDIWKKSDLIYILFWGFHVSFFQGGVWWIAVLFKKEINHYSWC